MGESSTSSLPPEKLSELRKAVKEQLNTLGVNDQIKSLLKDQKGGIPKPGKAGLTKEQAIEELKGKGVIDQLVKSLSHTGAELAGKSAAGARSSTGAPQLNRNKRYLHMRIKGGSRFLRYSGRQAPQGEQLLVAGELFGQRFRSAPVPAAQAPRLEASALIELPGAAGADPVTLVSLRQSLHLVVLRSQAQQHLGAPSADGTGAGSAGTSPPGLLFPQPPPASSMLQHRTQSQPLLGGADGAGLTAHPQANGHASGTATPTYPAALAMPGMGAAAGSAATQPQQHAAGTEQGRAFWGPAEIVGACHVDWRRALAAKGQPASLTAELVVCGQSGHRGVDVTGALLLEVEVVPGLARPLDQQLLRTQAEAEQRRDGEATSSFAQRARNWWAAYAASDSALQGRPVRVLAHGEDGMQRPVCAFVKPLQLGRCLPTPREAARFVSLLAPREDGPEKLLGGGAQEGWSLLHTVIEARQASHDEKALLLCSLLLGFGLDAWVCCGTNSSGRARMWVLTRPARNSATFWEPSTGLRYSPSTVGQPRGCPHRTLTVAFNHRRLVASRQPDDGVATTCFTFEDANMWCPLDVQAADVSGPPWVRFDLQMLPLDVAGVEVRLECELRKALAEYRSGTLGLGSTPWDEGLAFLLMQSLAAYEHEAATGQAAAGNDEFQQSIRRSVPAGFTFKGVPQHHRSMSGPRILQTLLKEASVRDLLASGAPEQSFALRVRVTPFAEHVTSVWTMLALRSRTEAGPAREGGARVTL